MMTAFPVKIEFVVVIVLVGVAFFVDTTPLTGFAIFTALHENVIEGSYIIHFDHYDDDEEPDFECITQVKQELEDYGTVDFDFTGTRSTFSIYEGLLGVQLNGNRDLYWDVDLLDDQYSCVVAVEQDKYITVTTEFSGKSVYAPQVMLLPLYPHDVTVCLVDTGINADGRLPPLVYKKNIVDGSKNVKDTYKVKGHGTALAGLIASRDWFYPGLAPHAQLMGIKVFDHDDTTTSKRIIQGIKECYVNDKDIKADIMLLAVGDEQRYRDSCDDLAVAKAANTAVEHGVFVVTPAGNNQYHDGVNAPACASDVFTVGAVYGDGKHFEMSNCGDAVDVAAKGVDVMSMTHSSVLPLYTTFSGTSVAAAMVAGKSALVVSTYGQIEPSTVGSLVVERSYPVQGNSKCYGEGIIL
jgi:subtilisin family serine protease